MITLIIGQNAIGKSAYLKEKVKESLTDKDKIITYNMWDNDYLLNREYNKDRVEELEELFDEVNCKHSVLELESEEVDITPELLNILTIITKDGTELYLDEPENGLDNTQINCLVQYLYRVLDTFNNIAIVTHSELFFGILESEIKTVSLNKQNTKYELTGLVKDKYETID